MKIAFEVAAGVADELGECPIWDERSGLLWWVDSRAPAVKCLDPVSAAIRVLPLPEAVGSIAFRERGGMLAATKSGIHFLDPTTGSIAVAARPEAHLPDNRFNDGRCDRQGRFWAGTMHTNMPAAHPVGELYRYRGAQGLTGPHERGLYTQNGLAWSPEGDRMYLSDSHPSARLIWAYDYDADTATPSNRRVLVDMNLHPGRPDGAAVDADGCYWTCANDAGKLLRFTPAGELDRSIDLPVRKPSMCAFGGAALDTLFVTSIRPATAAADQPLAGAVFAVRPGSVRGLPEPEYDPTT